MQHNQSVIQEMGKGLDRFDMSVIRKGASITARNSYLNHYNINIYEPVPSVPEPVRNQTASTSSSGFGSV